jgi:hypothetical protein
VCLRRNYDSCCYLVYIVGCDDFSFTLNSREIRQDFFKAGFFYKNLLFFLFRFPPPCRFATRGEVKRSENRGVCIFANSKNATGIAVIVLLVWFLYKTVEIFFCKKNFKPPGLRPPPYCIRNRGMFRPPCFSIEK